MVKIYSFDDNENDGLFHNNHSILYYVGNVANVATDTLVLQIAQDAYRGNAQFTVSIDGKQVDGVFEASALKASGEVDTLTLKGNWGDGPHKITVTYINDKSGSDGDRNLYLVGATYNGTQIGDAKANIWGNGSFNFATTIQPTNGKIDMGAGPDTLVLSISQDYYAGNAQYKVYVDGKQVGGTFEASGTRKAGTADTVTLHGDWADGTHDIKVVYLNDLYNWTTREDRNLFVNSATLNGQTAVSARVNVVGSGFAFTTPPIVHVVPEPVVPVIEAPVVVTPPVVTAPEATTPPAETHEPTPATPEATAPDTSAPTPTPADPVTDHAPEETPATPVEEAPHGTAPAEEQAQVETPAAEESAPVETTPEPAPTAEAPTEETPSATTPPVTVAPEPATPAPAPTPAAPSFSVGININGAEYIGPAGEKTGIDFFPTHGEIDYFAAKGMDNIRLPIAWESLQPTLNGELDPAFLAKIEDVVTYARSMGMQVIIDLHNGGAYNGNLIGTAEVPTSAFADVWSKLATVFADDSNVAFDLMNEPQHATATDLLPIINAGIAAIREAGATQQILIEGVNWTSAVSWIWSGNAAVLGAPGAIVDPLNNYAFEVHQYLDDTSGTHDWVVSETIGVEWVRDATEWARAAGVKLYLGEFGVADNPTALAALGNLMDYLAANTDVWQGVSYFSAGAFWNDYMFSVEPKLGLLDAAQMNVLEKYINAPVTTSELINGFTRVDTFGLGDSHASISDIFDIDGQLVSRTIFDQNGTVTRELDINLDGSFSVNLFENGAISSAKLYTAAEQLLEDRTYAADHSYTVKVYEPGTRDLIRQETHNASGDPVDITTITANGYTQSHYEDGKLAVQQSFNTEWALTDKFVFDTASGGLQSHFYVVDHHYELDSYANGALVSNGDYSFDWQLLSWTNFYTDGSKNVTSNNSDGTKTIEYYNTGSHDPSMIQFYDALGHLISTESGAFII